MEEVPDVAERVENLRKDLEGEGEEGEEEENTWNDAWDEEWEIYYNDQRNEPDTRGETFGSPMSKSQLVLRTRDMQRVKERVLFYILDGFTPDAGPESRSLFGEVTVVRNQESGKVTGLDYKGQKVVVLGRGKKGFVTTANKTILKSPAYKEFYRGIEKCKEEFTKKTSPGVTRDIISRVSGVDNPEWDTVSTVESRTRDELGETSGDLRVNFESKFEVEAFMVQEKRELMGVVNLTGNRSSENEVESK